jgi:ubiquinone/menaquinone biosynthesis C-methylase UbiE
MEPIRYFDRIKKQLICTGREPTVDFWDTRWGIDEGIKDRIVKVRETIVSKITKKYLDPVDGMILEGGCGWGQFVASLFKNGYRIVGLDYAVRTVETLNRFVPELTVIPGDVRKLPFRDKSFSGYWSLGLIEHFFSDREDIANEMSRVIKAGGYLFITFPYMSPLRKIKAKLGFYKLLTGEEIKHFYQFVLNKESVVSELQRKGFELVECIPHDAVTGLREEVLMLRPLLQRLLELEPNYKIAGFVSTVISKIMSPIAGHCVLLIFRKN